MDEKFHKKKVEEVVKQELHKENEHGEIIDKLKEQINYKVCKEPQIEDMSEVHEKSISNVHFVTEYLQPGEIDVSKQESITKDLETGEIVD